MFLLSSPVVSWQDSVAISSHTYCITVAATGGPSNLSCWEALLKGWQPYHMGWKKLWWECVACPEDVEDEQAFRQGTASCACVSPLTAVPQPWLAASCDLECCCPWVSVAVAQLYNCRLCCDAHSLTSLCQ